MVGDTPEEPKEQKEQLNGIAFINQCHIMHSVHRLESPSTVYKQKFMNLLGISLQHALRLDTPSGLFFDTSPASYVKISGLGLKVVHPHKPTMLKKTYN